MAEKPTKEQLERFRAVARTCRGPLMVGDWQQKLEKWGGITNKKDAVAFIRELQERAKEIQQEHAPGYRDEQQSVSAGMGWPALTAIALPLIRLRGETVGKTCGRDLNPIVEELPWDGEVHEYECPDCGNVGTVRTPIFYD